MRLRWLGHACFLLSSSDGSMVVTDPYEANSFGGAIGYPDIQLEADVVTVSHSHADHCYTQAIRGSAEAITDPTAQELGSITVRGVSSYHDQSQGAQRGENIIFILGIDDLTVAHLGDLGHTLSEEQAAEIGAVDVLLTPVGGVFTIDAAEADQVITALAPKVVVPMHYKTECLGFDIDPVDTFLANKSNVRQCPSEVMISNDSLPPEQEVWVLDYAH